MSVHFWGARRTPALALAAGLGAVSWTDSAQAQDGVEWALSYQGDVMTAAGDGLSRRGHANDSLHGTLDLDLGAIVNLSGVALHADVNSTSGRDPNEDAGVTQGLDNIAVGRARTRLYEFWVEQSVWDGRASLRLGFQEINSEFYATDSSSLLINPSFGLPAEIASTGENGPSTFPSTALALRGSWAPSDDFDARLAVFDAKANSVGDIGGADASFDGGVLMIAEATWRTWGALSLGAWRYSDEQPDVRETDSFGDPLFKRAQGVYAMAEHRLWGGADDARRITGFARLGFADGDTSSIGAGWQAGLLMEHVMDSRPDSVFSVGVTAAHPSSGQRANLRDAGAEPASAEHIVEIAYGDKLAPWLNVQPDLQIVFDPGADRRRDTIIAAGIRFSVDFASSLN